MFHTNAPRASHVALAALALAALATPAVAQQGGAPQARPAAASPTQTPDSSAPAPARTSRFGRFGRVFEKATSTAATVGAKAGISKETAARLAITAATGGAGAAILAAREQGASSAAVAASRALSPHPSAPNLSSVRAGATSGQNALSQEALRAMTDLGTIGQRAAAHDPAAVRAIQALNAAMSNPDAEFVALQKRATAGDPTAAQQMMIREDAIAHAALGAAP